MAYKEFPLVPEALLAALDEHYPEACPDPKDDERTIWRAVGRREVVRFLRSKFQQQQDQAKRSSLNVLFERTQSTATARYSAPAARTPGQ